jgi:NlpC/P60 family putative phage cell wall peptidase
MPDRRDIVIEARRWIGTPWVPAGSELGVGANCLGFMAGVARNLGLSDLAEAFMPYRGHAAPPAPKTLLLGLRRHLRRCPLAAALPGDVLLFDLGAGLRHVALLSMPGTIVHAHQAQGKVVEQRLVWAPHSAYRIPGLD